MEDCATGEDENCNGDICDSNNGGCEQVCHNTPRGAVCACREGYHLDSTVSDIFSTVMQVDAKSCTGKSYNSSERLPLKFSLNN